MSPEKVWMWIPGSIQGQAGKGSEQPHLVEGGMETRWSLRSLPAQNVVGFCDQSQETPK